jgi:hypothetical protein
LPFLPPDPTPEEYQVLSYALCDIYQRIPDPVDKFILAFVFELHYTQRMAAISLGLSDGYISQRIDKIRKRLSIVKNDAEEYQNEGEGEI